MADYPLCSLGLQIKAHWKRHRPQMYRELEQAGKLEESVYAAQERTSDLMDKLLLEDRLPYHEAWELGRSGPSLRTRTRDRHDASS